MKINVLPPHIANMIAAGEVVERPASAVKEMIENSIDAGADNITVEIKKGGMTYIRVTDNGCGIEYDQVETAFLRHATSKIKTQQDLEAIYTLGFRGEALASIAAVSVIDVFTKTPDAKLGVTLSLEGGVVTEKTESGCPDGTTIVIKNLFYNTPARMKFLKNDATETAYVTDVVNKMILANPKVKIKLINNGKTVIQSQGSGSLFDAVFTVFGKEYSDNMLTIDYTSDGIHICGMVGNQSIARRDRRHQVFFVNGRSIISKTASMALSEAFKNNLMVGKFPVAVLNIDINNALVDVNVHPAKTEVRFSDDKAIYQAIYWAVKNALTDTKYVPEINIKSAFEKPVSEQAKQPAPKADYVLQKPEKAADIVPKQAEAPKKAVPDVKKAEPKAENTAKEEAYIPQRNTNTFNLPKQDVSMLKDSYIETAKTAEPLNTPKAVKKDDIPKEEYVPQRVLKEEEPIKEQSLVSATDEKIPFKYVGQVFDTYIIAESMGKMLLVDQHAGHERLYFEEFLEDYKNKEFQSQVLLIPAVVKLDPVAYQTASENIEFFKELGFELDLFGDSDIVVRMTPYIMEEHIIKDTVTEIVSLLTNNRVDVKKELYEEALHTMACKRAVKGNHALSQKEAESLLERLLALKDINTCPHGRPIMIEMSKYQLEKQFKRIV